MKASLNHCNSYTITEPTNENGNLAKYTKVLDYVKAHRTDSWSRMELLEKSGYTSKEVLNEIKTHTKLIAKYPNAYWVDDKKHTDTTRGYLCYLFAELNAQNIVVYDTKTRKWHCGANIDSVRY